MNALWTIQLFGELAACQEEERITRFATQKTAALLAYLAFYRQRSHPRDLLIELLWPDCELNTGRNRLSTLLSYLRHLLEPPGTETGTVLQADRVSVRLRPEAITTDVAEFERLLRNASGTETGPKRLALLQSAVALYRGELLPGSYEGWIAGEQTRLSERFTEALQELSLAYEQAGETETALNTIDRAILVDPYQEEAHRARMRLQAALGHPAAVRESYQTLARLFREELGAAPSAVTRELAERLLRDPGAVVRKRDAPPPPVTPVLPAQGMDSRSEEVGPVALPLQMARFFGRTQELTELQRLLVQTDTRLVTVTGPGGAGKTRLAIEAARSLAPLLHNRLWFVPLADLPDARLISYALARALKLSGAEATDPLEAMTALFKEAPCLLILDNFEHLLREETQVSKGDQVTLDSGAALIRLLLERAPTLRCLTTSRRALRLTGEQEMPLRPLSVPEISALPEEVLTSASASLYLDRAKLARPDFAVTRHNAEAVAGLCRKLEGIPLAIEMAAAWAKVLPPAKMLARLEERLDALTSRRRDLPARHQSLRATIDWSYDLLEAPQRRLLARLSVFRGGWTLEAAEAICSEENTPLPTASPAPLPSWPSLAPVEVLDSLTALVDKSLVVSEEADNEMRYRFLETVRQYSQDLLMSSGEAADFQARHYAFFMEMATASWEKFKGSEQIECLNQLEQEQDNMRTALTWARTECGQQRKGVEAELDLAGRLRPFWDMRGYWREGRERLEAALARETLQPPTEVRARALLGAGVLAANMGDKQAAQGFYTACLAIRRQIGETQGIGSVAMALGTLAREEGDFAAARRWYEESLEVARTLADHWFLGAVLNNLGALAYYENDDTAAQVHYEESLRIRRKIGDPLGIALAQYNLSVGFKRQRNFPAAYAAMAESVQLLQQVGDKRLISVVLQEIVSMELLRERALTAALFSGAAQRVLEETGAHPESGFQSVLLEVQQALTAEEFASAVVQGRALRLDQALEDALTILRETGIQAHHPLDNS